MDTDSLYKPYIDEKYKEFSKGLSTTDSLERKGIRIPILKTLAKDFNWKEYEIKWHEDVMLRGLAIGMSKLTAEEKIKELDALLPYLTTWDLTDTIAGAYKVKKSNREVFFPYFSSLLKRENPFSRRLGIVWLMGNRKKLSDIDTLSLIINSDDEKEYFVSMAVAWAFSAYYADDPGIKPLLQKLSPTTRKRAERKIRESRRCVPL